jgi:hypothetical protein
VKGRAKLAELLNLSSQRVEGFGKLRCVLMLGKLFRCCKRAMLDGQSERSHSRRRETVHNIHASEGSKVERAGCQE